MTLVLLGALYGSATAQSVQRPVPRPFPLPSSPAAPRAAEQGEAASQDPGAPPTEALLGLPLYPNLQYIGSYDAGQGQRYYLFGTAAPFGDIVAYYSSVLRQRGSLVFDVPPTHMFEVGRFREDRMVFPPGVTVKDYTWGGLKGYPNPDPNGQPERFPTVIQFVAVPPEERR